MTAILGPNCYHFFIKKKYPYFMNNLYIMNVFPGPQGVHYMEALLYVINQQKYYQFIVLMNYHKIH